jgi:glycosyltransferase involved in cell wall biosynthesis
MFNKKKVIVVMPAYNAAKTIRKTFAGVMDQNVVDLVIIVDDGSQDETVAISASLPHTLVFTHKKIVAMALIKNRVTNLPWNKMPILLSWYILIISIHQN